MGSNPLINLGKEATNFVGNNIKQAGNLIGLNGVSGSAPTVNASATMANSDERTKQINAAIEELKKGEQSKFIDPQQQAVAQLQGMQSQLQNAPSVVNQQVQNAQDQNLQNQMAMAASQRGAVNPALALRQQQQGIAQGNQQILQQSLPAALQEKNQNIQNQIGLQSQIANVAGQGRQQDQAQIQLQNSLALQYMQLGLSQDAALMQAQIDIAKSNAELQVANSKSNKQFLGGILQTGGALAGMYLGGPAGAAVGSQAGAAVGQGVG